MGVVEFLLSALLAYLFWRKGLQRRFPWMGAYLALRVGTTLVGLCLYDGNALFKTKVWMLTYWGLYWTAYLASAVLLYFVCMEVFRSALTSFSGLTRFGLVIFRWAALASVIVAISTVSFAHRGVMILPDIAYSLMRSVSILELCLLGFLCLSMNALQVSLRDTSFGIALGFGIMASNDLVMSLLVNKYTSTTAPLEFAYEAIQLVGLGAWITYCVLPEPARQPVVVAANSTIYRWNEIASALGHKGTNVAVPATGNGFFLSDVEKVVDKVLTRNLREGESSL
jgi:hypothetical protein